MNHEDTKTQRAHEDNFVLLSAFESLWFKFKPDSYRVTHYREIGKSLLNFGILLSFTHPRFYEANFLIPYSLFLIPCPTIIIYIIVVRRAYFYSYPQVQLLQ